MCLITLVSLVWPHTECGSHSTGSVFTASAALISHNPQQNKATTQKLQPPYEPDIISFVTLDIFLLIGNKCVRSSPRTFLRLFSSHTDALCASLPAPPTWWRSRDLPRRVFVSLVSLYGDRRRGRCRSPFASIFGSESNKKPEGGWRRNSSHPENRFAPVWLMNFG